MTFFYDLNKRLAALASKQDAKQISEDAKAVAPKSKLAESLEVAEAGSPMTPKQKKFAKLAPPEDKITFADKIAGAKKEVDEMLGDVAADAMRKAITSRGGEVTKTSKGIKHRSTNAYGGTKDEPHVVDRLKGPKIADEGNAFTGKLKSTPKGSKFKMGDKEYTDHSEVEEGFADMDAWLASREKEKGTGKFDKKERTLPGGMKATTYTRKHEDDKEDDSDESKSKDGAPKKRGRPMGKPKGPERTTAKAWKHKGERKVKEEETDEGWRGGMLGEPNLVKTRRKGAETAYEEIINFLKSPQSGIEPRARQHLMKLVKELNQQDTPVTEKAKSKAQQKFMGMVHATQKGEKAPSKEVAKVAKEMPKKAAKDFAATKHKGLPEKVKAKKEESKEDKVDETTTSGSVATASSAPKAGKGMQFGKGVYESFNSTVEKMITESVDIAETISEGDGASKTVTVTASGPEADMLMQLLKAAGLTGQESGCSCGKTPCGCEQVDENSPDWPTDPEQSDNALQYSGGLNGPKSTGQTTTPVIASQLRRQVSMEENVELERSLFTTWKNYKG